ncbi:type IV pili methyl-accepting chemotaxis transducer N-terminal domain-containing protein [Thauera aminoaromatica]|uniref:NarX-like N-terminal domain-containing protein n=1 Tax=Thauera aminoaromatica TaxID=164330 RepID=A0A5C7SJK0_THASP|nr:type IV pili methyl-accepting chemotaxis transducer N-terminal domain-containing protein [Thauera aminoaromatica]TXH83085.1 MAG: hypothetical protein E6Q80_14075 [Thauera aminoaromatica]
MQRREFLIFAAASSLLSGTAGAAPVAGTSLSLPVAINKSGRLRMLSQRGAKAWLLLVLGVLPDRSKSILAQSLASFEQILGELKTLQPGDDIRGLAQALEQDWRVYRPQLADLRADPKAVWAHSESVLAAAQKLTVAYEKAAGTSGGQLVNLSGRQRMLSQRMAKAYLFRQMGVNAAEAGSMLDTAMKEFAKAHEQLKAAAQSTAQIKSELALVEQQWFFFQNALQLRAPADRVKAASDVATTSERILEQMDLVVALYERL